MQELVGGYVTSVSYGDVHLMCNEDGIMRELPVNRRVLGLVEPVLGTFFMCRGDDGLLDEDIEPWMKRLS